DLLGEELRLHQDFDLVVIDHNRRTVLLIQQVNHVGSRLFGEVQLLAMHRSAAVDHQRKVERHARLFQGSRRCSQVDLQDALTGLARRDEGFVCLESEF
ncbi:MAG TPA: hypothetical protein PK524_03135, partial [Brevefilum fermentans]|nr:hypothetical protein [Brevefilum fermentans]